MTTISRHSAKGPDAVLVGGDRRRWGNHESVGCVLLALCVLVTVWYEGTGDCIAAAWCCVIGAVFL